SFTEFPELREDFSVMVKRLVDWTNLEFGPGFQSATVDGWFNQIAPPVPTS
ncbi:kinase-like domain, partial [Cordyceps militaris]